MPRAVALLSGGLDSMLAIRILQEQGFEVDALNIITVFECCQARAALAAVELDVRLTVRSVDDDYLDLLRRPVYGYGRGVNPCIDCRIYMMKMARRLMEQLAASVVISGEVLGQRPMSQKHQDLTRIACQAGLEGRLLRPLSARLLPPTIAECEGIIDRAGLYGFSGRGRKPLVALAKRLGIREIPGPSTGCSLTEPSFAPRVRDLIRFTPRATRWEFEILSTGRHFRLNERTKLVVGRNARDNATLRSFAQREGVSGVTLMEPRRFPGPTALVIGSGDEKTLQYAAALILHYSRRATPASALLRVTQGDRTFEWEALPDDQVPSAVPL